MTGAAIAKRAAGMCESDAAWILTMAEEPELILEPGELPPALDPLDIAAARLISDCVRAELSGTRH